MIRICINIHLLTLTRQRVRYIRMIQIQIQIRIFICFNMCYDTWHMILILLITWTRTKTNTCLFIMFGTRYDFDTYMIQLTKTPYPYTNFFMTAIRQYQYVSHMCRYRRDDTNCTISRAHEYVSRNQIRFWYVLILFCNQKRLILIHDFFSKIQVNTVLCTVTVTHCLQILVTDTKETRYGYVTTIICPAAPPQSGGPEGPGPVILVPLNR